MFMLTDQDLAVIRVALAFREYFLTQQLIKARGNKDNSAISFYEIELSLVQDASENLSRKS